MNEKDFIGKIVVSMSDGAKVGTVKDLVFHGLGLSDLLVAGERGEGLLPFDQIGTNGPDAVTVPSYSVIDWNAGRLMEPDRRNTHDLRKLSVVDSDGTMLGTVHDLTMTKAGKIQEIDVRTEGVFGLGAVHTMVAGGHIRAIGAQMITVDSVSKK